MSIFRDEEAKHKGVDAEVEESLFCTIFAYICDLIIPSTPVLTVFTISIIIIILPYPSPVQNKTHSPKQRHILLGGTFI